MTMKLIVGLGNPGRRYAGTRHNVGFMAVDEFSGRFKISAKKERFDSLFGIGKCNETPVCVVKPQTFMNLSGGAVAPFVSHYGAGEADLLVVHDDIDMALGRLKFVFDSGSGGHNGVASIIEHTGNKRFWRLKVGIGRPADETDAAGHVLERFSASEKRVVSRLVEVAADAIELFIKDGHEAAMQKYNNSLASA